MALENWVKLPIGVEVRLHFREYRVTARPITDPTFGVARSVQTLLLLVDREDGVPVDKVLSIVSEKLANEFKPYLGDGSYRDYEWFLVKDGPGFAAPRVARRLKI